MEKEVEILLGKFKHVKSVNVDNVDKIQLINRESELTEYDVYSNVNASETYVTERERNAIYRIYGRIDYVSMLNGLKLDYKYTTDYYEYRIDNSKNIFNSFKFYVVKPSDKEYVSLYSSDLSIKKYIRKFEVIATPNNIDIYPAGFTNNIFGKQVYAFNVNIDIDVREMYDYLGFPLTELYLMPCYIKKSNGFNTSETISGTTWESNGIEKKMTLPSTFDFNFNVGDVVETNTNQIIGDLVYYNENEFKQNINSTQTLYIKTYHKNSDNQNSGIVWKYNPLIPLRLRYLSNDLSYVSSAEFGGLRINTCFSYDTEISGEVQSINDNSYPIAANDINTKRFIRPNLHWTDFIEVPENHIKSFNSIEKKGFKYIDDVFNIDVNELGYYRNGVNSPSWGGVACPLNGGKKYGIPTNQPDSDFYFYKGLGESDCIKFVADVLNIK